MAELLNSEETIFQSPDETSDSIPGKQVKVLWSQINLDLGKHHNAFIEEFPDCLFVRVIECGSQCTLKTVGPGGLALIREDVMLAKAERKMDNEGRVSIDKDLPFFILESDIIAFGKFENF